MVQRNKIKMNPMADLCVDCSGTEHIHTNSGHRDVWVNREQQSPSLKDDCVNVEVIWSLNTSPKLIMTQVFTQNHKNVAHLSDL